MSAILKDGALWLSGYVGGYFYDDGFTASDVLLALAQVEDDADLDVHLNSGGGIATEGAAIHALLASRSGTTNIIVEGIAASAASLIAMAGDSVVMAAGAILMIHDPSGFTMGTSAEHSKTIEGLEALATAYARVYAAKSGKTADECRAIMKAERWYAPDEAVAEGFADSAAGAPAKAVAAFDYRIYAHAPKRLAALASKKKWSIPTSQAAPAAAHRPTKENTMSDKTEGGDTTPDLNQARAEAATGAKARIKAIMTSPEAKGREALAEHFAYETEMTPDAVTAALKTAPQAAAATQSQEQADKFLADKEKQSTVGFSEPAGTTPATGHGWGDIVASTNKRVR